MILKSFNKKQVLGKFSGFTLIELLVVVTLIAILTGILFRVMNVSGIQAEGDDAVRIANLGKLADGIEAYYSIEAVYPPSAADASDYIEYWPNGTPAAGDVYSYDPAADGSSCVISVPDSRGTCYVYDSTVGKIQEGAACPGSGSGSFSWYRVGPGGVTYVCDNECASLPGGLTCSGSCNACSQDNLAYYGVGPMCMPGNRCDVAMYMPPPYTDVYCCCGTP